MKTKRVVATMIVGLVSALMWINDAGADVIGGYINTQQNELVVVFDAISTQKIMIGASLESIRINAGEEKAKGELFVVFPNGRFERAPRGFFDRYSKISIAAPTGSFDKIVYVDRRSKLLGGLGLSEKEIAQIAQAYKSSEAVSASKLLSAKRQRGIFESVNLAAESVRQGYKMDDEDRRDIFEATVGWTSGIAAQKIIAGIMESAENDDAVPFIGLADLLTAFPDPDWMVGEDDNEKLITKKLIRGVDVIYPNPDWMVGEGDNGGPGNGFVNEGDNGGPGNGFVNEGDNGGPGTGIIMHGWNLEGAVKVPEHYGFSANCLGTFVYAF